MKPLSPRIFKTKWFNKAAKAAGIADVELCRAAKQLTLGMGNDLGGNVWKKRLDQNRQTRHRGEQDRPLLVLCLSVRQERPREH